MAEPGYSLLHRSGELQERAERLRKRLADCDICPRECRIDRLAGKKGFCRTAFLPRVASVGPHHGEEPVLSGTRGSGTIFFGGCNLKCRYCQNFQISQDKKGEFSRETDFQTLAGHLLKLQEMGCQNINFVSPSHVVPQIVLALVEAVPMGLNLPLVYNSSGYDAVSTLVELDRVIDIYLPDLRYADDGPARKYSRAREYVAYSRAAIREMYRQVGNLETNEQGIAVKGIIVRHLILPGGLAGSEESLRWLAQEISPEVAVSIMSQYYPAHRAAEYKELSRKIRRAEYDEVVEVANRLGLENGWLQQMGAEENYLPDFREEKPFGG